MSEQPTGRLEPAAALAGLSLAGLSLESFYPVKRVPQRIQTCRRLHPKVPIRWCIKGAHGCKLRYVSAGRQKLTTDAWVLEFLAAVAEAQQREAGGVAAPASVVAPKRTAARDAGRREKTKRLLAAAGLKS